MNQVLLEQMVRRLQSEGTSGNYLSVLPTTGTDDKTAIQARISEAVALGRNGIHFGDGQWTINCGALSDSSFMVTVPSNFAVTGNGWGRSVINVVNVTHGAGGDGVSVFGCVDGTSFVKFNGLHFRGDNGTAFSGSDFTFVLNNQNSCITTVLTLTHDVSIEDCYFEQLWGFSIHDPADDDQRISFTGCTFVNCANGPNVNSSHSIQTGNLFIRSEGIEASGAHSVYGFNTFQDAQGVAISVGGNQGGVERPGSVVIGNTIEGSTGNGIIVNDGFCHGVITKNIVRKCAYSGFKMFSSGAGPVTDNIVSLNIIDSNCAYPDLGVVVGMDIDANGGGHTIVGNLVTDSAVSGYRQVQGMSLNVPNCFVSENRFKGNVATVTNKDASFGPSCTGLRLGSNYFVNGSQEFQAGCTTAADLVLGVGATDRVREHMVWNDSPGAGRRRYSLQLDGKMTWGDGLDLEDVTLYRNAADQLKTDDKFLATAGIGVGNSAAASVAVGTLVKKIEVFDASGNSLGFVPVYSSIT